MDAFSKSVNNLIITIMKKFILRACVAIPAVIAIAFAVIVLSSCNVTRRVTTESSYYQRGDTTIQIVTKTTESYDATKKTD